MLWSTTAPSSPLFTTCLLAASEIPEWANITANGDSAHTQTRAESFRTARTLISAVCAIRLTNATGSCGKLSCHRNLHFLAQKTINKLTIKEKNYAIQQ